MNLYQLSNNLVNLIGSIVDEDGCIDVNGLKMLEETEIAVQEKSKNIGAFILNLSSEIEAVNGAVEKMKKRASVLEKKKENLLCYLLSNMEKCSINEISSAYFSIRIQDNPESILIEDENLIDNKYFRTKITKSVDKIAIKNAIKDGENVKGAFLIKTKRLIFK